MLRQPRQCLIWAVPALTGRLHALSARTTHVPSESHHVFRPLLAYPAQGCCTVAPYNLDVLSLTAGTCTAPQASVRGNTQEGQQMHFCCRPPCCPALPGLLHALHPAHNVAAASMRKEPCGACSSVCSTTVCTACRAPCAKCCSSQHQNNQTHHLCGSLQPCMLPHNLTCSALLPLAGALFRTEWLQGFAVFPLAAGRLH